MSKTLAVILAAPIAACSAILSDVSSERAHALVSAGAALVDVRSPEEYAEHHAPGAVNIPVDELATRLSEVGAHDRPVVVYCRSGVRSRRAQGILRDAGFADVYNLGGLDRW